jgi:spoIIIJ-associated protein
MMTQGRKYFSGNSIDSALLQAARHHGLRPEEIAYRQIDKRHGFLRARKGVLIEVDPESPRKDPKAEILAASAPPASEPEGVDHAALAGPEQEKVETAVEESQPREAVVAEAEPEAQVKLAEPRGGAASETETDVADDDIEELIEAAQRGLEEILAFTKLDLEFEVNEGEDELEVELYGPDRARLLEDRGNLILSIQHLLPRFIRGYTGRSIPCHVDSENYHETRRKELKELAEEVAAEVRHKQRPRTLPPMNPAERRIIHVTLADEKDVTTESQGRGFFKRVTISPAMRRPRGFDRYNR